MDSRLTNYESDSPANDSTQADSPKLSNLAPPVVICPACGASVRRVEASYCAVCGKAFADAEDYLPADALRASYYKQHRPPQSKETAIVSSAANNDKVRAKQIAKFASTQPARNLNNASQLALAFATYALVPYLGILFCPGAIFTGCVGLARVRHAPHLNGRRASMQGIVAGILIFCAQLFLWWILYKVPEWGRGF
jgi:hypothetical protein